MPASTHPAAMFSSATDDWATPVAFYDRLDAEFGFALDVCASTTNRKSATFYALDHPDTERRDGLARDWVADAAAAAAGVVSGVGGAVWMNPPYGNPIADWMGKAHQAARDGATVVCLVPVRSDTAWWQDLVLSTGAEVRYVRGRLKFGQATTAAPFASAVVIYRPTDIPGGPGPVGVMSANAPVTAPAGPSRSAGPAGTDPADEVAAYVATFTPRRLDEAAWALAAPVVRPLVTAANPHSVAAARLYLSHLVGLLSDPDVWDRTGTPAIAGVLARPVVNAHLARTTFKSARTKATHRDTLYRLQRSTWQLKHPAPRVPRDRADTFLLAGAGLDVSVAALMRARANLPRAPRDGLKEVVRHLQLDRTDLRRLGNVAAADDSTVWTWASLRKLTEAANQELTVPSTASPTTPTQTAATPGAPAKPTSRRARIAAAKADHDNRQAAEAARAARAARLDAGPAGLLVLPTTADLAEPIRVVVERFEPQKKARNAWAANRDLAMALVTAYNPSSPRTAQTTCSYVALLLTWLEQRPGHPVGAPVSVGELLEEGLPEKWINDLHWSDPSKASARSVLRRIVRTLNPDGAAVRLEHHGVTAPYSPQMCDWFALAAWRQPTQATTRDLCFVVGLGLGAGLDARDLRHLTRLSFTEATHAGKDVLFVAVTGDGARERVVPVRDAYVALVRRGLELHEATGKAATDLVLGKVRDRNNVVGPVVNRTRTATTENVEVRMSALRNTWLVAQLCSPISLADLLPVAGLASGRTIAGLLAYCPAPDAAETDAVLATLTGPNTRSTRSVQSGLPVQTEAAAR